jgi:predicted HD phosphohydrolase
MQTVSFTQMKDGTFEDYALLDELNREHREQLADRVLASVAALGGSLSGYKISRFEHSLQTATRAERAGASIDWIVAALIHDIGDELAPENHSQLAASVIRPYVPAEVTWVVNMHGVFQQHYYGHHVGLDPNARDAYRDHPWYGSCERFCAEWDQTSFDPDYESEPLEHFEPMVREVFGRAGFDPTVVGE